MVGFSLAHLQRLDNHPDRSGHEPPGERYWFRAGHRKGESLSTLLPRH
jgi:hypothetical protein